MEWVGGAGKGEELVRWEGEVRVKAGMGYKITRGPLWGASKRVRKERRQWWNEVMTMFKREREREVEAEIGNKAAGLLLWGT